MMNSIVNKMVEIDENNKAYYEANYLKIKSYLKHLISNIGKNYKIEKQII